MQGRLWAICFLVLVPGLGLAQTSGQYRGQGYLFFAPGARSFDETTATLHFGGGGEGLLYKGLGAGAELGYIFPARHFRDGLGLFSANGSYHFLNGKSSRKLVPFVTGGYSLLFRGESANLFNFGGGINYWFRPRTGLRVEFRDHVWPANGNVHYWGFRLGVAFR